MTVDTTIFNARIYTQKRLIEGGIAIDNGHIIKIVKETNLPPASTKINLKGNIALPGLIDSHVHLRDQQLSYKEDFQTGTTAAAAGGITTVIDMPNNRPVTMNKQNLQERMNLAKKRILVNVAFNSALPSHTDEVQHIIEAGAKGFKLYLLQQIGGTNIDSNTELANIFKTITKGRVPIAVHAEDKKTIETLKEEFIRKNKNDVRAFLQAHPPEAEEKAIKRVARLARVAGARVHICHVSSKLGLRAIVNAKKSGCQTTCEVTPHHLLLTTRHLIKQGNLALEIPPLRPHTDVDALWKALQHGLIDTIASDHAPHSLEEKQAGSIWDAKPGIAGLETMLPLLLTQVNNKRMTIQQLVNLACREPATIFHLDRRGQLEQGSVADITVVNLKEKHRVDASKFYSKAKFSPFDGWNVRGKAVKTFVSGHLVMDEGQIIVKPGAGLVLK